VDEDWSSSEDGEDGDAEDFLNDDDGDDNDDDAKQLAKPAPPVAVTAALAPPQTPSDTTAGPAAGTATGQAAGLASGLGSGLGARKQSARAGSRGEKGEKGIGGFHASFAVRVEGRAMAKEVLGEGLALYRREGSLAKAVDFLVAKNFIPGGPRDVSAFLRLYRAHFSPDDVGDYLGSGDGKQGDALRSCFVGVINFRGLGVLPAFRHFLTAGHFRLPGEAQKADRLIAAFANSWWADNARVMRRTRGSFLGLPHKEKSLFRVVGKEGRGEGRGEGVASAVPLAAAVASGCWWEPPSADAVYLLAFSVIMLNTDLHRTVSHKKHKKMTREQYVHNLSRSDAGLPARMLEEVYDSVAAEQIQMPRQAAVSKPKEPPRGIWRRFGISGGSGGGSGAGGPVDAVAAFDSHLAAAAGQADELFRTLAT